MNHQPQPFFVLTGGPGSGKSTLIDALNRAGHATFPEAGRAIIQQQVAIGGRALPWIDPLLFAEVMLSWDVKSYHLAQRSSRPVFFDRGVVDVIGYLRLMNLAFRLTCKMLPPNFVTTTAYSSHHLERDFPAGL